MNKEIKQLPGRLQDTYQQRPAQTMSVHFKEYVEIKLPLLHAVVLMTTLEKFAVAHPDCSLCTDLANWLGQLLEQNLPANSDDAHGL